MLLEITVQERGDLVRALEIAIEEWSGVVSEERLQRWETLIEKLKVLPPAQQR
jgi:hypothetical protein